MELHHIHAFVALADELSVTRAAARLHLSQPNLTRKLKHLEDEIGVTLFHRTNRGLYLTQPGRAFLEEARGLLAASARAVETARRCARREAEQLRVGYLMGLPGVTSLVAGFQRVHPEVTLSLSEMTPAEQLRTLQNSEIDLGFIGLRYSLEGTTLAGRCIARYETVIAIPAESPLARKRRLRMIDLEGQLFLGVHAQAYPHWDKWAKDVAMQGVKFSIAKDGPTLLSALLDRVAANLGVSLFPEHCLSHEGVVFRPMTPPLMTDLYVAWNPANKAASLRKFLAVVGSRPAGKTGQVQRQQTPTAP